MIRIYTSHALYLSHTPRPFSDRFLETIIQERYRKCSMDLDGLRWLEMLQNLATVTSDSSAPSAPSAPGQTSQVVAGTFQKNPWLQIFGTVGIQILSETFSRILSLSDNRCGKFSWKFMKIHENSWITILESYWNCKTSMVTAHGLILISDPE